MASQDQLRQQMAIQDARHQRLQEMAARRQSAQATATKLQSPEARNMPPRSQPMGAPYDDLPVTNQTDAGLAISKPTWYTTFESACQNGIVSMIESIISSESPSPAVLHHGLVFTLQAGHVEASRYLLSHGAPIVRQTPDSILAAPQNTQIPLFELLNQCGWTPNAAGYYGAVLLPRVVTNLPLLRWFLAHGANPNLGPQRDQRDRTGPSDTDSAAALESAAARAPVEAVRMLLDAGARIQNGNPLHYAAGVYPPGTRPPGSRAHMEGTGPSKEFDVDRIPVMQLLVERGADVNKQMQSRHMDAQYAIVYAVMAGAVERVKWLLQHGADPHAKGGFGTAVEYAMLGNEEMKTVMQRELVSRRNG